MHNKNKFFVIAISLLLSLLYITKAICSSEAVISVPVANIYTDADENSSLASQAIYGSKATILQTKSDWALINTDDNYQGWVKNNNLLEKRSTSNSSNVQVKNLFAYVYRESSTTDHLPLLMLPYGVTLPLIKVVDEKWLQVKLVDGVTGWIQQGDVNIDPKPLTMEEMLKQSHNFIGLPYRWGGTSTFGIDCSGLVQFLYRTMGVIIPRDTSIQMSWPRFIEVTREQLKPGDIIYFGWEKGKITHEALYLGNNLIIHSTAYKNPSIQIGDLRLSRWKTGFVTARRLNWSASNLPEFQGDIQELSTDMKQKMRQYTWHEGCPTPLDDLSYVTVTHVGFDGKSHRGALIVNTKLASEVLNIFKDLYDQRFPIEKIEPIEEYGGDDNESMVDNNSSAFNCRAMTEFADKYSIHSYGRAIDINPLINPYTDGTIIEPKEGAAYLDRNTYHKGKITEQSIAYKIFTKYGWTWGGSGSWSSKNIKDYQHFEKRS